MILYSKFHSSRTKNVAKQVDGAARICIMSYTNTCRFRAFGALPVHPCLAQFNK